MGGTWHRPPQQGGLWGFDAPYDDVVGAIRTVKGSSGPSVAYRFRQACRSLVATFTDDR